jgi:terminal uridylyltransferase
MANSFHPGLKPQPYVQGTTYTIFVRQCGYLDSLADAVIPVERIYDYELANMERFRVRLRDICRSVFLEYFGYLKLEIEIDLNPIGSVVSGLALKGSDMDMILHPSLAEKKWAKELGKLPELFEKKLLDLGHGALLLSKTKVPILRICESPDAPLMARLKKRIMDSAEGEALPEPDSPLVDIEGNASNAGDKPADGLRSDNGCESSGAASAPTPGGSQLSNTQGDNGATASGADPEQDNAAGKPSVKKMGRWLRRNAHHGFDFPEHGCGLRCDISFTQPISTYNTRLVKLYTIMDRRVQLMILFVKIWAKRRKIASNYHGTLCSYGWTLLVLHYLLNVASPPVIPNLQTHFGIAPRFVDGHNVSFFDNEQQLREWEAAGMISQNFEPLGSLLRGFFLYYARAERFKHTGFDWHAHVVAIRVKGGLLTKSSKHWNKAQTIVDQNGNQVRSNFLLAVECPIDASHNVARSVSHSGHKTLRVELNRACQILSYIGRNQAAADLMEPYAEELV